MLSLSISDKQIYTDHFLYRDMNQTKTIRTKEAYKIQISDQEVIITYFNGEIERIVSNNVEIEE